MSSSSLLGTFLKSHITEVRMSAMPEIDADRSVLPFAAAHVWSLPHIRSAILSHLSFEELARVGQTSRSNFSDALEVIYETIDFLEYRDLMVTCQSELRQNIYNHSIRTLDIPCGYNLEGNFFPELTDLLPKLPRLRFIDARGYTIELASSEGKKFTGDLDHSIGLSHVERYLPLKSIGHDVCGFWPDDWNIEWTTGRVTVHDDSHGDVRHHSEIPVGLYRAWQNGLGSFTLPMKSLRIEFPISITGLVENIEIVRSKKRKGPQSIQIIPLEDDPRYTLNDLIEKISPIVETMSFEDFPGVLPRVRTTIYDYFRAEINWPTPSELNLKRLHLLLNVSSDALLRDDGFHVNQVGPAEGLEEFRIVFDLRAISKKGKSSKFYDYIPTIHQTAEAMLRIGGRECRYSSGVLGTLQHSTRARC